MEDIGTLEQPRRRWFTATQVIIVVAIVCTLALGLDFSRRIATTRRIQGELQQLNADLGREQARNAALQAQLEYVQSDAYVEDWARSEQKWVRPGEYLVVPVIATPVAGPPPAPVAPPAAPAPWQVWWAVISGNLEALVEVR